MAEDYFVKKVDIICTNPVECERYSSYSSSLVDHRYDLEQIKKRIKFILNEPSIRSLDFKIIGGQGEATIVVNIIPKKVVSDLVINIDDAIDLTGLYKILPINKGGFYEVRFANELMYISKKYLEDIGLTVKDVDIKIQESDQEASILLDIKTGGAKRIGKMNVLPKELNDYYKKVFLIKKGQIWDRTQFKMNVDQYVKELQNEGFYFVKIDFIESGDKNSNLVDIEVLTKLGNKINFNFNGNKLVSREEIMGRVKTLLYTNSEEFNPEEVRKSIDELYASKGVFKNKIKLREATGKDKTGIKVTTYSFDIIEGRKYSISGPNFSGNAFLSSENLDLFYKKNSSDLASNGHYDQNFLEEFSNIIRKEYLKNGYIFAKVFFTESRQEKANIIDVEYKIRERQQCVLSKIVFNGIPLELENQIRNSLVNKEGNAINVIEIDADLKKALKIIKDNGYYFAEIQEMDPDKMITYSANYSEAAMTINVDLYKKTLLDEILITGNQKTKSRVILREIDLIKGDLITIEKIERIKEKLSNLGLFSIINITPVVMDRSETDQEFKANLLIQLKEKDFGIIEVAPGFRTDIGLKISFGVTYNNIFGLNLSNNMRAQANQRLDYSNLDSRRRGEKKKIIEANIEDIFSVPYFMNIPLRLDASGSIIRRRYYGFDADILRGSAQFSKTLIPHLDATLRYQVEAISQYDATNIKDDRFFRIGSLTPALTLDLRDEPTNPHRGAFFSISCERASPLLWSMKSDSVEINYVKVINRNRFYVPIQKLWTLALSVSYGVEKNIARQVATDGNGQQSIRGQIPSIKVFRLDGVDTVRGYADSEINRLENHKDISEVVIDNKAYFATFKFEPRYNFDENMVIGPFFDAGRVYKDQFTPQHNRKSFGVTYKYLTPVGSLDFDYGVKINRQYDEQGHKEKFGRFHLSIGFF